MDVKWTINRLGKMPPGEVIWRIREKARKRLDSRRRFKPPVSTTLPDPSIFSLSKELQPWPAGADPISNRLRQAADNAMANRFNAFGISVRVQAPGDWHRDPVTRRYWPEKFWGDINIRQKKLGGVKFVWEFNRLYALFPLAAAYARYHEKRYADRLLSLIRSWVDGNPYPIGVNWSSAIEAGVRLANLVWALSLLAPYRFRPEDLELINAFVFTHAAHLARYPSKYSSSNNHRLAEAFGLFLAGRYFPHLPGAGKWLSKGKTILERECCRQILPDGGSFEHSTTYLSFVMDFFLLFRHCCLQSGLAPPPGIEARLEKACEFIHTLSDRANPLPNIGDQDSAVLVNFGLTSWENLRSILNTGALAFQRSEYLRPFPDLKTRLLTGMDPGTIKQAPGSGDSPGRRIRHTLFPHSGLAVIHDRSDSADIFFTGNASPMGLPPLYAHGHLDALSFTLSVNRRRFMVDPGTYRYHNSAPWRTYFRSTAAHNTIRLGQTELSGQSGDFMFGKPYRITGNRLEQTRSTVQWTAGHDAYGFQLERCVVWHPGEMQFRIQDRFEAPLEKEIELFFHFHPDCSVISSPLKTVIKRENTAMELIHDPALSASLFHGSSSPVLGWYSPDFNQLAKAHTLRISGRVKGMTPISTCLKIKPSSDGNPK